MTINKVLLHLTTLVVCILLPGVFFNGQAQSVPFNIEISPIQIDGLGGLQSFAVGQYDGKWVIVGGRLDGLHRRQPWAAFDVAGHNNQVFVVDPISLQSWTAPVSGLPAGLAEQLRSTNMQFHQSGDYLYVTGGYGRSDIANDHITFNLLTAINLPGVIDAVINDTDLNPHFRSIADENFRVTGGHMNQIGDTYHLVGGQKFMGRYNPIGPDHGPGFIQEYTNAARRFLIDDDGDNIEVTFLESFSDAENLHRRDYNVVPQIMPDGQPGLTAFSGVFQYDLDLPFLNSVDITESGHTVNNDFTQYYNHYHCAHIPIYSESQNEMHSLFFGGIAQFYDEGGVLIQDDEVPFVRTIARVTRSADGTMAEYKLPIEMPALLGAGSEFIMQPNLPLTANGVIQFDQLEGDTVLLGHIFGGISSSGRNIFFINDGTQSEASNQIFEVYLLTNQVTGLHQLNAHSTSTLKTLLYPNPNSGKFLLEFNLSQAVEVELSVHDVSGKILQTISLSDTEIGGNYFNIDLDGALTAGHYLIRIDAGYEQSVQRLVIQK